MKRLMAAVTVFQNAEKARLQKIADEVAARDRAAWEKQQAAIIEQGMDFALAPPKPPEPVKVKSGGAQGKAVSLRTYKVATIVDYDKALVALKDHPEMKDLVQKLAEIGRAHV